MNGNRGFMFDIIFTTTYGNIILLAASIVILYFGADFLVKGSVNIAASLGIQKLVIGITIVAAGTSMPEFTVSLVSQLKDVPSIALGNVIGSNIFNIAFILGAAAIIRPLKVNMEVIKIELPILFISTLLFNLMCLDGNISQFDAVILAVIFFGYMFFRIFYSIRRGKRSISEMDGFEINTKTSKLKNISFIISGLLLLVLGADILTKSSIFIAKKLGISELVIGLTIVAAGTSMPELFTSIIASAKKQEDISIGNITGSNFFNIFFILGITGLFGGIKVGQSVFLFDNWINFFLCALLFPLMITGFRINRFEGGMLFSFYIVYALNLYYKWIVF
jgi:cation:H+ antiporter